MQYVTSYCSQHKTRGKDTRVPTLANESAVAVSEKIFLDLAEGKMQFVPT